MLSEFDEKIDDLEQSLGDEYQRYQAEQAKEEDLSKKAADAMDAVKHVYLIIKHQKPDLLESFQEAAFGPLTPEMREEFLDDIAILEVTKLDAILKREA
jgi:hypothetical protein